MPSRLRTPFALCLFAVLGIFGAAASTRADELSDLFHQIDQLNTQFYGALGATDNLMFYMTLNFVLLDDDIVSGCPLCFEDGWPDYVTDQLNYQERIGDMESARQGLETAWVRVLQLDRTYKQEALGAAKARRRAFNDVLHDYRKQLHQLRFMDKDAIRFRDINAQGDLEGAIGATQLNRNQANAYFQFTRDFIKYLRSV